MNSDYIVYVDESGDHSLTSIDHQYPVFVLALCVFRKDQYANMVVPAVTNLKFKYFGHDQVILHERKIRKALTPFTFLQNRSSRTGFMNDLDSLVAEARFTVIAGVVDKLRHRRRSSAPANPYDLALTFALEQLARELTGPEATGITHIVFESRGEKEDKDLRHWFRRIREGRNALNRRLPFDFVFAKKATNSSGLQFADLIARPIGRHVLSPGQPNRAFSIIDTKLRRDRETGRPSGLEIIP